MKILALDSTAIVASVALCEDGRLLGEYTLNNKNTHSETLLPMIESLLHHFGLDVGDIDLFAMSEGPGSFTGVRIGAATLKGLAFASGKPCVGVPTTEALAENLSVVNGIVCPVMNARRNQVYTAVFRMRDGVAERLMPDSAIAIPELIGFLQGLAGEPLYFTGDGYELTTSQCPLPYCPTPERLRHQSAFSVAVRARAYALAGQTKSDAAIAPTYLRLSQAERERNEREKNKGYQV